MRFTSLRSLSFVVLACATASAGAQSPARAPNANAGVAGTLFIVGGGTQSPALVQHFVALAGGPGKARIVVFPMATADAESEGRGKAEQLQQLGASAFVLNPTHAQADLDSVVRQLDGVTGVWFVGGDQVRITRALGGTATLRAVQARYRAGAVIGGTSAGAAIMSDSMLTGNQFAADGTLDTAGTGYPRIARHSIEIVPGLGFLHGAVVDQHFLRRQRSNRLMSVILERPTLLGVGIDEGTALRVDPDGRWAIEGASAALVIDARSATVTDPSAPRLGAAGLRVHLLPAGSTFDPRTGTATLPH